MLTLRKVILFIGILLTSVVFAAPATSQQVWNLRDANVRAVIQAIAAMTGKTFIIDPRVQGKISLISEKPMDSQELYRVFLSMLQVLGYAAIPSGSVVKIVPANEAKQMGIHIASRRHPGIGAEIVVRVVPVSHVSAAQMVPVLRPLIQNWGSVSAYIPANSLILVGAASNLQHIIEIIHNMDSRQRNTIAVVRLRHASAEKLVGVLEKLQNASRAEGKVSNVAFSADPQDNSILISGSARNIYIMRSLIRRLDNPPKDTSGQTMVVHLKYLDAKKLAPVLARIALGSSAPLQTGKDKKILNISDNSGISIEADETDNAIIMRAPIAVINNLKRVIRQLDSRPSEVLVEAIIVKINQELLNKLGIVWSTVDKDGNSAGDNTFALSISKEGNVGFINGGDLQALTHLLFSNSNAEVLATPSVVVLNNATASISDGQNIGIVNRQYSSSQVADVNLVPFNTIERKDVTLSLKVTPRISPNNMLQLKIEQRDDSIAVNASSAAQVGSDNPVLNVSKIKTNVLVRSGDILVLGGLTNHNQNERWEKIPILGDIPLLGYLFKYKEHQIQKQDLMVFIRPIILHNRYISNSETKHRYNYMLDQQRLVVDGAQIKGKDSLLLPRYNHFNERFLPAPHLTEPARNGQYAK